VLLPATIDAGALDAILRKLDGGISERRSLFAWEDDGVVADALASELPVDPVGLLMLEEPPVNGDERASYWIACPNFYAITRYNRSRLYASAVFNLARAVKTARESAGR
ncbi:MAG TPA: lytic murein transglycosylase, partial [Casimicrobiaceae bacterium]|jgi:membrane-bound lytic murein transglycosylase B